jgi:pimeloyl-ACP methyl ester carboxylesterase
MGSMAKDAAALLGELGISRTAVLGISMGGNVAQELALAQPSLVSSLVLGCTNCGPSHSVPQSPETIARFGQIASLPPNEQTREFCVAMVSPNFAREESDTLDALIAMHMGTAPETFSHHMGAIMTFDSYDRLPDIRARTRIIHGDQDIVIPAANATVLEERIPNADVRIMDGAGHMFVWERPQEAAEMITEFLAN